MILLIDLDDHPERLTAAKDEIPEGLRDRVFILGASGEPEALKTVFHKSFEDIGLDMACDCREETEETWGHDLLENNAPELDRLRERVCPILFPTPQ
jgi:hypothetical protein